ncbi:MAG: purL [Spirochaetes bacterium]|nr:MAG: purL [Spirochaetota bacterium]
MRAVRKLGLTQVRAVQRMDLYFVRGKIAPEELDLLGRFLFSNPVTQAFEVQDGFEGAQAVEIAYLPGVTDPVADEILRSARELGIAGIDAAATGARYEFSCEGASSLCAEELDLIARNVLSNPVVQRHALGRIEIAFPDKTQASINVEEIGIHRMDDRALGLLDSQRRSALDPEELAVIRDYFRREGRPCTDVEYETIAQTWSEHCYHKTFKARIETEGGEEGELPLVVDNILKTYIKAATDEIAAPWVVSAFKDNAGIIEFDEDFDISFKVETHNHPSAIEPFGGANTGVGGVIRDVMAVSARPIAVTDILCFGAESSKEVARKGMSLERIRNGIVAGIQDYGNKMGIPTVNGGIHYHEKYATNPLVYCGCVGIAPKGAFFSTPEIGDRVFVIGGKTGRDGIRGATFSSMTMDGQTYESAGSSVQIGAPIVEKMAAEVIVQAREKRLYSGITDCGAGGLSSAVGEMASELGADVELSKVALKYPGLSPWEIWLSEAQERMVLAIPMAFRDAFIALCDANDVGWWDLGAFTGDGKLVVRYQGRKVLDLSCEFLHKGMPGRRLKAKKPTRSAPDAAAPVLRPSTEAGFGVRRILAQVMAHPAVASKEWAIRRYDHEVQGGTIRGPFSGPSQKGPSDAAVVKPLEIKSGKAISISNGFNPRYGEADAYNAAYSALDEAVRNAVAVGADPDRIAVTDNFCWGDPRKPENLWTLLRSAKACRDASVAHRTPFISGKDSFNNEFVGKDGTRISVPPSLLISAIGIVPQAEMSLGSAFKIENSRIYLVGEFKPELSASVYGELFAARYSVEGRGPEPSLAAPKVYRALHRAISQGLVLSCHDISDGGLAAAAAEMCLGGGRGAEISVEVAAGTDHNPLGTLFGETNGCFLAEVPQAKVAAFETALKGLPRVGLGTVLAEKALRFRLGSGHVESSDLEELGKAYTSETDRILGESSASGVAGGVA